MIVYLQPPDLSHTNFLFISDQMAEQNDELIDYSSDEEVAVPVKQVKAVKEAKKGSYVGIHATGFRDFLLKPELLNAIGECGFEHPSEGILSLKSSTRMYSASNPRNGRPMSSKVRYGENCCVCVSQSSTVR